MKGHTIRLLAMGIAHIELGVMIGITLGTAAWIGKRIWRA